jgi:predicted transposase YbfD/YdcC
MKTNRIGYWNEKKEKLKHKYTVITNDDLHFREGKENEMMEKLGRKLGKSKEELRQIINAL